MFRYDERDPQCLVVYTGDEHAVPDDYRKLIDKWIAWVEKGVRFGVVLVSEPHEHHEDENEEDHRQHEAEISRLINDFRRDYHDRTAQINLGFARVFTPEVMQYYMAQDSEAWERGVENNDRFAQYNWGIPGGVFREVDEAKRWIHELAQAGDGMASRAAVEVAAPDASKRVGLFYGSSTGITEYIAEMVEDAWVKAGMEAISAVNIGEVKDLSTLLDYDCLILGIPTWNIGQMQDDWDILYPQLDGLDFSGKKIAIFGIGDQHGYPDNFLDAVGILGAKLIERDAELVGFWFDEHYQFRESLAFVDDKFMGLGIDDTNQSKLNHERIERWVAQIIGEFELQANAVGG